MKDARNEDKVMGLSPRVRGNQAKERHVINRSRSIPACAGEPASHNLRTTTSRVYPRVCGGTKGVVVGPPNLSGLSPRVRGNPVLKRLVPDGGRSIPACAGEPTDGVIQSISYMVYPRVCGGTNCDGRHAIPACAGEPPRRVPGVATYCEGLSPRVRGNLVRVDLPTLSASATSAPYGLSPRVRGNRLSRYRR